ncbi:uncharacterized protein [Nicotiana sylvestris]|uniref:uncharacterized protein n=1 Tax=Nicotiana sylvestris TaxID=4096 RepID=UPI00388CB770
MKESLREFPATTWNDVYNKYNTKHRIEEDMVAQPMFDERAGPRHSESGKRIGKNKYEHYMGPAGGDNSSTHVRVGDYSFNVSISELVAVLKGMGDKVRWPKEMRSDPRKRNPDHWFEFHNDHGHRIADYWLLQGEVENLLKQGYLTDLFSEKGRQSYMKNKQEPPKPISLERTVNVITGGDGVNGVTYTATKKTSKVTVTHGKRIRQALEGESITFDDEDVDDLMIPHNDTLFREYHFTKSGNEIQANDKVIPKAQSLYGFDNSSVITKGEVVLAMFAEGVTKDTRFQVIDADMTYNIILGRPWIHKMDDVPSTMHEVIKFPS